MIREAVETLGPPGVLPSQEAVLTLYGPEPVHEAQAIVGALTKILNPEIKTILNPEVQELREAVYPFTFPSYPESFQGDDESMTNALINDPDVQRARRVMGRLKEHSRRKSDRHV
jgi:hypothetical protein